MYILFFQFSPFFIFCHKSEKGVQFWLEGKFIFVAGLSWQIDKREKTHEMLSAFVLGSVTHVWSDVMRLMTWVPFSPGSDGGGGGGFYYFFFFFFLFF